MIMVVSLSQSILEIGRTLGLQEKGTAVPGNRRERLNRRRIGLQAYGSSQLTKVAEIGWRRPACTSLLSILSPALPLPIVTPS